MKRNILQFIYISIFCLTVSQTLTSSRFPVDDWQTPFEKSNGLQSATYDECISYYEKLQGQYSQIRIVDYGTTSIGKPLNLVVISSDNVFTPADIHKNNKRILFINNGIHPGEPDGIDACMMLARDLVQNEEMKKILDHLVVCIVPVYNISGCLNRGSYSRANQDGPVSYGFRGNYQNLDLNRDFIKCDSKEAETFNQMFSEWQPELLIDTHVSDGADYQYTMTYIATQKDKLNSSLANYMTNKLQPALDKNMKDAGFECCPYVTSKSEMPDSGIVGFLEIPRFSTGYAALHNCIGFVAETHMLKPFRQRVLSTYQFCLQVAKIAAKDFQLIGELKAKADDEVKTQQVFGLHWILNDSTFTSIVFKGYSAKYKISEVTGQKQLYYDEKAPWTKKIPFYNNYKADVTVTKPIAYVIPQAYGKIISLMKLNGVVMKQLSKDMKISGGVYFITGYKTSETPYENHYLHRQVQVQKKNDSLQFYKGDFVIVCNQSVNRYIVETLEPQGVDSWFAWNQFDADLQEKEYFSDYVFDTIAVNLLKNDPSLKKEFDVKRSSDTAFAKDAGAQLFFIYQHSPYYEKSVNRYPLLRIETEITLPLE